MGSLISSRIVFLGDDDIHRSSFLLATCFKIWQLYRRLIVSSLGKTLECTWTWIKAYCSHNTLLHLKGTVKPFDVSAVLLDWRDIMYVSFHIWVKGFFYIGPCEHKQNRHMIKDELAIKEKKGSEGLVKKRRKLLPWLSCSIFLVAVPRLSSCSTSCKNDQWYTISSRFCNLYTNH